MCAAVKSIAAAPKNYEGGISTVSSVSETQDAREEMTGFWQVHSKDASLEEMVLNYDAEELTKHELPEVLSYLPSWEGKDVLELGSGIGRFTGELAGSAKHVTAVDFMEKFIIKNQEVNSHYNNIDFKCADVTKLNIETNSVDLIFSNWLLMYLGDEEVHTLIQRELSWLKDGGYLFVRESCFRTVENNNPFFRSDNNPTEYRDPAEYLAAFTMATMPTETDGEVHCFELVMSKSVNSYLKLKKNPYQIVWLLQKTRRKAAGNSECKTVQEFIENLKYTKPKILLNEKMFGGTFVSPGGIGPTKELLSRLDLRPGQTVLDVGCRIGGSAFYMVKEFGVKVVAIATSYNMVSLGMERARELGISYEDVEFEIADATKREYKPDTFDIIYSRDTVVHIPDKLALLKNFHKWSKKGGKLLISDYCCSDGEERGYTLLSPNRYCKVLKEAGFAMVQADDRTDQYVESLEKELARVEGMREEYIKEVAIEDFSRVVEGIKEKLNKLSCRRWVVFYAEV